MTRETGKPEMHRAIQQAGDSGKTLCYSLQSKVWKTRISMLHSEGGIPFLTETSVFAHQTFSWLNWVHPHYEIMEYFAFIVVLA